MAFLTQEQLDALAQFDTPTICNAIEGFGVRGRTEGFTRPELRMRAAMSDKPMVGYARTGVISARQPATPAHSAVMEAYYRQYEDFDLPMVAAIQDLDRVPVGSFGATYRPRSTGPWAASASSPTAASGTSRK